MILAAEKNLTREDVKRVLERNSAWHRLNKIDDEGETTQKLLTILPRAMVSTILRIYRVTKYFKDETERYDKLPKKRQFPKEDFERIQIILKRHQTEYKTVKGKAEATTKWISREDINAIMTFIRKKFKSGPRGTIALHAQFTEIMRKQKRTTKPTNEPLNFAVYLMAKQLKAKGLKISWDVICSFLTEQKAINREDAEVTPLALRDRYRKTIPKKIERLYDTYRELYLYSHVNTVREHPYCELAHAYLERDITLPAWHELIP